MSKHPVKIKRAMAKSAAVPLPEVISPRRPRPGETTFSYTYASISLDNNRAHVKSRRVRLSDGKLEMETFEGNADPSVFGRAVVAAQRQFLTQAALLWQPFASMLPSLHHDRGHE